MLVIDIKMVYTPITISVEGNIGAGKSTFIDSFEKDDIEVAKEPLHLWQNVGAGGENLLSRMYENPKQNSFLFQMYALLTTFKDHMSHRLYGTKARIVERFMGSMCFIKNSHKIGNLTDTEYHVLTDWTHYLKWSSQTEMKADVIVYLRTSPEKAFERIKKRKRKEELNIPFEYIQQLHEYHEEWLMDKNMHMDYKVIVIDADLDLPELTSVYEETRKEILEIVRKGGSD